MNHGRGDDDTSLNEFCTRDYEWAAEYNRLTWFCDGHHLDRPEAKRVAQIAATICPGTLRKALLIRIDRRIR